MNKAIDVATPIFLQGVSMRGHVWGDIHLEAKLSDLDQSADEFAERKRILTEQVCSEDDELDSLPDRGAPSGKTVRGITGGPVPLYGEQGTAGRRYAPIEEQPHLFRTFAELDRLAEDDRLNEEAIKDFADKYGLLGLKQMGYLDGVFVYFEQYEDWSRAVAEIFAVLTLYDTFIGNDHTSDANVIYEDGFGSFALDFKVASHDLSRRLTPHSYPEVVWDRAKNDYQLLFRMFFREIVSEKLNAYCTINLNVQGDIEELGFDVQPAPQNLLGAMWLQVAMMAERKVIYKKCGYCQRTIPLADVQKNTVYCKSGGKNSSCKTKASAQRKSKTLELSAQGLTVEEIARMVDSNPSQIVKWIESAKAEKQP